MPRTTTSFRPMWRRPTACLLRQWSPMTPEEPLLGAGWDPDEAFGEAVQEQEDDGLLGDGWFQKLRQAVLTPLRQLTFWHGKNQAREFGERGAAKLLRAVMAASPARVHLMGHSFGTIVVSSAVRGPGKFAHSPAAAGQLALPGAGRGLAVGVLRGRARLDRRRARLPRRCRDPQVRLGTDRRDALEMGLRRGEVLPARGRDRRAVPPRRRPCRSTAGSARSGSRE